MTCSPRITARICLQATLHRLSVLHTGHLTCPLQTLSTPTPDRIAALAQAFLGPPRPMVIHIAAPLHRLAQRTIPHSRGIQGVHVMTLKLRRCPTASPSLRHPFSRIPSRRRIPMIGFSHRLRSMIWLQVRLPDINSNRQHSLHSLRQLRRFNLIHLDLLPFDLTPCGLLHPQISLRQMDHRLLLQKSLRTKLRCHLCTRSQQSHPTMQQDRPMLLHRLL